jgi:Tol biopolymer transport system component/predicted Ser/Thr protein kinase
VIGKTLASYQVTEKIGAGGMGEVYRARDTKLGRDVAIKVLPPLFAQDPERLGRFRREAKVLAGLNHANIATLYGLEEADGQQFLIMELVEGEDLAERLSRGALSVAEALKIVRDVAAALQTAHAQGVVHRDLKPANIKITPDGRVKVLDFGLAKALETAPTAGDLSHSPTIATGIGTMGGVILGTAAYMSPEQARGKPVDKLTDIWAIGAVLYETLTGQHAFPGETVSDTIAKILEREPDWSALPASTPPAVQLLLRRCLQKDKTKRLQDVGDVRIEVDETLSGASAAWTGPVLAGAPGWRTNARAGMFWKAATAAAAIVAVSFATAYFRRHVETPQVIRAAIPAPAGARFVALGDYAGPVVISPDGKRIAFTATGEKLARMLWVRELDGLEAKEIPGTEAATFPFWSPDSRSIGYFNDDKLMRVSIGGGLPITVCDAPNGRGGTWNQDGVILFSPDFRTPIHRVQASGGTSQAITVIDSTKHTTHRWPYFLPDGKHFLYVAAHHDISKSEYYGIYFASIDGGEPRRVLPSATDAQYASGHLLFQRDNTLLAVPFDPNAGRMLGEPVPLIDKVSYDPTTWRAAFSVSQTGILVYHGGQTNQGEDATVLTHIDREGRELPAFNFTNVYYALNLSPDGKRVAATTATSTSGTGPAPGGYGLDISIYDIERDLRTRLTFGDGAHTTPVWSPDGTRIAYATVFPGADAGANRLIIARADGAGEETVLESRAEVWLGDWSRDGKYLVYCKGRYVGGKSDIWVLPLFGDKKPFVFRDTPFQESNPTFSPDGRWVAYVSDESGAQQVYVTAFDPAGHSAGPNDPQARQGKWQISSSGGTGPTWRSDGKELYFIKTDGTMWAAAVNGSEESFHVGEVKTLFVCDPFNFGALAYAPFPDGQSFIVNSFNKTSTPPITLVTNWMDALQQ